MDCIEHCDKARTNISACATCTAQEKLDQICRHLPKRMDCPGACIPVTCDNVGNRDKCLGCPIYGEGVYRYMMRGRRLIWAESGRRVLHPDAQAAVERILADDAREMAAERNAFSYLTADEGNPWGSHEGL